MKAGKSTCHPTKTTPFAGSPSTPNRERVLEQRVHLSRSRQSLRVPSCPLDELAAGLSLTGSTDSVNAAAQVFAGDV